MKTILHAALAAIIFLVVGLVACDESTTINEAPPTAPVMPQTVTAAGSVGVLTSGLQCRDESICKQDNAVVQCDKTSTLWEVFAGEVLVASKTGAEVQFNELSPGDYTVRQTAYATDGQSDQEIYNRTVVGS